MGAIADAMVDYARPLIDATDGSLEEMNNALALSQICWNLSLLPPEKRRQFIDEMRPELDMSDDDFDEFRRDVVVRMVRRHEEMFPRMHQRHAVDSAFFDDSPEFDERPAPRAEKYPGTERYAPCPCNSGKKYKFCCGVKGR